MREEFDGILRFWLDRGVDGFRIDVAHGMVKADGLPDAACTGQSKLLATRQLPYFDQDGVHEIYREWRKILDSYPGERIGVAEAWVPSAERLARYLRPDELHQAFNFHFLEADWAASIFRGVIDESLDSGWPRSSAPSTWVLSNHDVQRHVTRYGGGELGLRRARAAALLTLPCPARPTSTRVRNSACPRSRTCPRRCWPGPDVETFGVHRTGPRRVPGAAAVVGHGTAVRFRWSGAGCRNHGTGPRSPSRPSNRDPGSTLSLYREALRHATRASGGTEFAWCDAPDEVLAFRRGEAFVCTVNFSPSPVTMRRPGSVRLTSCPAEELDLAGDAVTLPPNSAVWWSGDGNG